MLCTAIREAYSMSCQITPQDDPRNEHIRRRHDDGDALPHNPLHDHNPWRDNPPDPEEEDIDRVTFNPAPGIHFSHTTIRSNRRPRQSSRSPFDELMESMLQSVGGIQPTHSPQGQSHSGSMMWVNGRRVSPQNPQNPFAPPHPQNPALQAFTQWRRNQMDSEGNRMDREDLPRGRNDPFTGINAMMQTIFAQMPPPQARNVHGQNGRGPPGPPGAFGIPDMLRQVFDPSNAVHGDHALTQEAFDRIIGQMMQEGGPSSAPGPASEAAIAALPKKKVEKSMLGSDGKAECSVCMENVEVGDDVTFLPCNHWFHGQCVGAWLKEHDTCPHCRKGIMPATGEANQPRSPNQRPLHNQNPFSMRPDSPHAHPQGPWMQPGMQQPYVPGGYPSYPEPGSYVQPPPGHPTAQQPMRGDTTTPFASPSRYPLRSRSRGSSSRHSSASGQSQHTDEGAGSSGGGGGLTGWIRNLRGSNRSSDP